MAGFCIHGEGLRNTSCSSWGRAELTSGDGVKERNRKMATFVGLQLADQALYTVDIPNIIVQFVGISARSSKIKLLI